MSERTAEYWIDKLRLEPHPEGGYFRETYRAVERIDADCVPPRFSGSRSLCTAIYYLLPGRQISRLHRLLSDELWHFHEGSPLALTIISPSGERAEVLLGPDPEKGQVFQALVPKNHWFGAQLSHRDSYALVGCTVAPGFDFRDFETAHREELIREFPEHRKVILQLT